MAAPLRAKVQEAARFLLNLRPTQPRAGLILGSGLGRVADEVENALAVPYRDIPYFPLSTVEGHAGRLILGRWRGREVVVFQGRFHFYEGYSLEEVTFPVRVTQALGARTLLVTNAAGGINPELNPGDLMLLTDHINFMGTNPLIGPNDPELGPRFPSLTPPYSSHLAALARQVAREQGIELKEGVYIGVTGPSFETPAELRAFARWGADAVGMSTVPEVIVAAHAGLALLAVSVITNSARGHSEEAAQHGSVLAVAEAASPRLTRLLAGVVSSL
ncbi:MAG TPA: purine-nucleoside phosphorylase [Firmicutes bacterium]|nr:purine-nucleoside phosphorylase [Bacillota bacterium]